MTAPRRRMQTRIAGLLATGALIILGPASVASAATTSATSKFMTGGSAVAAGAPGSLKAGTQASNSSKPGHGTSKGAHGHSTKQHRSGSAKNSKGHKHGKKSPGPNNPKAKHHKHPKAKHHKHHKPGSTKPKANKPKSNKPRTHKPQANRSNAPGSGILHGRTTSPQPPAKNNGNKHKKPTIRNPNFQNSSSSSSATRTADLQSSAPAATRSLTRSTPPVPSNTPRPTYTHVIAPAVAAPARTTTPMTADVAQPAHPTGRTRPSAPAQPNAASSSSSSSAGAPVPADRKGGPENADGRNTRALIPMAQLGPDAQLLIGMIGIVGFALALAAIVTGYRGARRV